MGPLSQVSQEIEAGKRLREMIATRIPILSRISTRRKITKKLARGYRLSYDNDNKVFNWRGDWDLGEASPAEVRYLDIKDDPKDMTWL